MLKERHVNDKRKILFIVWIILLSTWATMTISPLIIKTGRFFVDNYDRTVYFEIGKWFTENTHPISQYPQIPTLLFGIDHVFSMWLNTHLQFVVYTAFFSLEMIIILFFAFKALLELLPSSQSNYAFLLLLPPTIYFSYNRFDILPAFLCLIAYSASTKKQWILVSILLALATFTKWYPALLFPGFLIYATRLESKFQWKMVLTFSITCLGILILSYLQGGAQAILTPYEFHVSRNMESVAFPVLIYDLIRNLSGININLPHYFLFLFIISISIPVLVFFVSLDSLGALTSYCIVTISTFVLFSRIWSPQWFLWVIPFLIISIKSEKAVILIITYNIITYLCFPVIYDFYGDSSIQLKISAILTYIILFIIIVWSVQSLNFSKGLISLKQGNFHTN
jgi:hypothetical protein